jgi:serine/threonine protein kinase
MNCFSCSKNIHKEIICEQCSNKFCSDSCIAFHYSFYHQNGNNKEEININNYSDNTNNIEKNTSNFLTDGYVLKEIKYESIYDIKNFKHHLVNGKPKLLGYGSFGNVYLEINKINKKFYAIKHIEKRRILKALNTLEPIYNEIKIQSKICHPNIVKILYANESEKYFDIVLEYANKGNLFYYIKDNEYLSESQSFKIFIQIVNAIYFLHKNNFIHRDIKPENILLFDKNIAKLCDFGWCVEFKDEPRNTFCGTTEYMAPEMLNEKNYGKEIDIWSLGILLYEMLHGHSPFKPDKANFNDKDVIKNIIYQKNIKYKSNLSKECIELMTHLIDKNIKRRYSLEDIINSKFVKKFEKSTNNYKLKNIREFQKINSKNTIKTINTTRTNYTNNYLEQKDKLTINKNPNINRRNTSKYNTRKILNSFLSMENDNSNNYIINKENSCKNIINNSNSQRNGKEISQQNNFSFRTISPTNTKKLNLKFSSPKIDKINKNKIQREEDFENDNLSNIFNDHSIFNNYKENKNSNNNNYKNPPTININILLNEINFSSNNNNNYEQKILDKIFGSDKTNSFKKIINSPQSSRINSSKLINRDNNFIKNRINIFTSKNFNINNLNDKKSFNNPKNIPISIRPKNDNISNNSEINEFKNNKLIKEGKTSNLTNIDDSSKNNPLYISNNLEIIKTPKKEEETFLLKTKFIFSNLSEELRIFNNKK